VNAWLSGSAWVRTLVTVGVLAYLLTRIDVRASIEAMGRLSLTAALGVLALVALDRMVMVWRWVILLRAAGAEVSTKSATWIYLVSSFVGSFLPAGVGGDAARAYTLAVRTSKGSEAVASVGVDRILGLLSILVMGAIGLVAAGSQIGPGPGIVLGAGLGLVAAATACLWADYWIRALLPTAWHQRAIGRRAVKLADAFSRYRGHRPAVATVFLLSVGVQILRILQAWILGLGIGIALPFSYYLFFMPIGLIALMLPISISGFGAPQGVIVWLLQLRGVSQSDAFALSTLIVITGIVANLPGAWLYLRSGRAAAAARTS
jgi:uncharacterized membrane protein YbhN (UPF0104 family)